MREVTEMVDHYRGEQMRRDREAREEKRKRREMMDNSGIPT